MLRIIQSKWHKPSPLKLLKDINNWKWNHGVTKNVNVWRCMMAFYEYGTLSLFICRDANAAVKSIKLKSLRIVCLQKREMQIIMNSTGFKWTQITKKIIKVKWIIETTIATKESFLPENFVRWKKEEIPYINKSKNSSNKNSHKKP